MVAVGIWPEMKQDVIKCLRRIVFVINRYEPIERMKRIVERYFNFIIGLLLEIGLRESDERRNKEEECEEVLHSIR